MGLAGFKVNFTFARGVDAIDDPVVSGGDEERALGVEGHAPNVVRRRIEEHRVAARGIDLVDLRVGGGRRVYVVVPVDGQGMHLDRAVFKEGALAPVGPETKNRRARPSGGEQISLRIVGERPEKRSRRLG